MRLPHLQQGQATWPRVLKQARRCKALRFGDEVSLAKWTAYDPAWELLRRDEMPRQEPPPRLQPASSERLS
jgi:hypothetical protein